MPLHEQLLQTRRERPKSAPYLRFKNIQGTTIGNIWKKLFFKKGRTMPKNSKRGDSGSLNVSTNRKLQKQGKGVHFDRIRKFSKKSRIVPKKPKGGTLWSRLYFWKHKTFVV